MPRSRRIKDMTGMKFGKLTVISEAGILSHGEMFWNCECECGNKPVIRGSTLRNGMSQSCGCRKKEIWETYRKYNEFYVQDDVVHVKLTNTDQEMLCDAEDWEELKRYTWSLANNGYACTNISYPTHKRANFHKMVMNTPSDSQTDHINRNRLDNRKCNLRIVSAQENVINRGLNRNNTSGHRGVSQRRGKWVAQLTVNYENKFIGTFENIEDAIKARKEAEIKYFGREIA